MARHRYIQGRCKCWHLVSRLGISVFRRILAKAYLQNGYKLPKIQIIMATILFPTSRATKGGKMNIPQPIILLMIRQVTSHVLIVELPSARPCCPVCRRLRHISHEAVRKAAQSWNSKRQRAPPSTKIQTLSGGKTKKTEIQERERVENVQLNGVG